MQKVLSALALVAICFLTYPDFADAQAIPNSASVVSNCGTPPSAYEPGQNRSLTQDTSGSLCSGTGIGDSGPVSVSVTVGNETHASGTSVGGLFTIPIVRTNGGSGIVTNILWKSNGGSIVAFTLRLWSKLPANTTCTDDTAFSGSDTDDTYLVGSGPTTLIPQAPGSVTGDSATYASLTVVTWDYRNADTTPSKNLYACIVTNASDTADANAIVRLTLSGPQN